MHPKKLQTPCYKNLGPFYQITAWGHESYCTKCEQWILWHKLLKILHALASNHSY
jgi:hypothetical protein